MSALGEKRRPASRCGSDVASTQGDSATSNSVKSRVVAYAPAEGGRLDPNTLHGLKGGSKFAPGKGFSNGTRGGLLALRKCQNCLDVKEVCDLEERCPLIFDEIYKYLLERKGDRTCFSNWDEWIGTGKVEEETKDIGKEIVSLIKEKSKEEMRAAQVIKKFNKGEPSAKVIKIVDDWRETMKTMNWMRNNNEANKPEEIDPEPLAFLKENCSERDQIKLKARAKKVNEIHAQVLSFAAELDKRAKAKEEELAELKAAGKKLPAKDMHEGETAVDEFCAAKRINGRETRTYLLLYVKFNEAEASRGG